MLLSLLIPTTIDRRPMFICLLERLKRLCNGVEGVEIMYCEDDKEMTIGAKRQHLIESANGEYAVQVDSDDDISNYFISEIMTALKENPDCVTYLEAIYTNGKHTQTACHSNKYQRWANNQDGYQFVRCPFYKDVIRTSIAKQIGFKDMRYGEDNDFSLRLKQSGLIKTEVHIPRVMYIYNAPAPLTSKQHRERYGIK